MEGLGYRVVNLLRTVETPGHVVIKKALLLGRWQQNSDPGGRDPRRTLVEFANAEQILGSSGSDKKDCQINHHGTGRCATEGDSKGDSPGFNTAWLQAPRMGIHKLDLGVRRKDTPRSGAGGERSGWAQFRGLSLEPTPDYHTP